MFAETTAVADTNNLRYGGGDDTEVSALSCEMEKTMLLPNRRTLNFLLLRGEVSDELDRFSL